MTIYGGLFILIGAIMAGLATRRELRIGGFVLGPGVLYIWHTLMVLAYWVFAQTSSLDATSYYEGGGESGGIVGTDFVFWLTGLFRSAFPGASFLDISLLYGLMSYAGLLMFLRSAATLAGPAYTHVRLWAYALAMMPGLSFWTGAIGKDAPVFLAIQTVIYGVIRPQKTWPLVLAGFALAFMIRPQIALLLGVAVAVAFILSGRVHVRIRIGGAVVIALLAALAVPFVAQYLGVRALDQETLSGYVFEHQNDLGYGGSAVDLENLPLPLQIFTYLYRPTLLEARTPVAAVAALENAVLLGLSGWIAFLVSRRIAYVRSSIALMSCGVFFVLGATACAIITANLGMAERQKEMFVPLLFLLLIACLAERAWNRATARRAHQLNRMRARQFALGEPAQ